MTDQQVDLAELQSMISTLSELIGYTEALRAGASGFAYMLPSEWQGPAMSAFLSKFETWAASAAAMKEAATGLHLHATTCHSAYSQTINNLDGPWNEMSAALSA